MHESHTRRSHAVLAIALSILMAWSTCFGSYTYAYAEDEVTEPTEAQTLETQAEGSAEDPASTDAATATAEGSADQTAPAEATDETSDEQDAAAGTTLEAEAAATPVAVGIRTHVQDFGWLPEVSDGGSAGTTGKSKRVEGFYFRLKLSNNTYDSNAITATAHVQDYGWMGDVSDGTLVGTTGESKRVEAIKLEQARRGDQAIPRPAVHKPGLPHLLSRPCAELRLDLLGQGWRGRGHHGLLAASGGHPGPGREGRRGPLV